MKNLLFAIVVLASSVASAGVAPCQDWPAITGASGPSEAATGMPYTYNFRLSCALGSLYSIITVNTRYTLPDGESLPPADGMSTYPLPSGELLYQVLASIPGSQTPGNYAFQGSVEISDASRNVRTLLFPNSVMEVGIQAAQ